MDPLTPLMQRAKLRSVDLAKESGISAQLICDVRKGRRAQVSAQTARALTDVLAAKLGEAPVQGLFEALAGLPPPRTTLKAGANGHGKRRSASHPTS